MDLEFGVLGFIMMNYFIFFIRTIFLTLFLSSCTGSPLIQPQIDSLVVARYYDYARSLLDNNPKAYGENNKILYWLDFGTVNQLTGQYSQSIHAFQQAKKEYDRLFTQSLTKIGSTWLLNDTFAPYRGEDFERVMMNLFAAMDFAVLGNWEGALVEARDVDRVLKLINRQYKEGPKNVYKEDAFARLLMGMMYEAKGREQDINDALIEYQRALTIYQQDYAKRYKVGVPRILQENLLAAAQHFQFSQKEYRDEFRGVNFLRIDERRKKAQVVLIQQIGFSPIKHPIQIPIPLPGGYITQLAFSTYDKRDYDPSVAVLTLAQPQGKSIQSTAEVVQDVGAIAIENLNNRKFRVIAKAALRAGGKYLTERELEKGIEQRTNQGSAAAFRYISSIYNVYSEEPDLRSWQTLPDKIAIARLFVDPGQYNVSALGEDLGLVDLQAGETKVFVIRSGWSSVPNALSPEFSKGKVLSLAKD